MRRIAKEWIFGILWILIYLLPVCGIVWMAVPILEHRLYGASIGFCLLLASFGQHCLSRLADKRISISKVLKVASLAALPIMYACLTMARNNAWNDEFSVWEDAVKKSPYSVYALNNFGVVLTRHEHYDLAIKQFQAALQMKPMHARLHNNLGAALYKKGAYEQAVKTYQRVLQLNPASALANNSLGIIWNRLSDHEKALQYFQKALGIQPDFPQAHGNIGAVYFTLAEKGHEEYLARAIQHCKQALLSNPNNCWVLNNLALIYLRGKEFNQALPLLQKAARLCTSSPQIHLNLGLAFFNTGNIPLSIDAYQKALQLQPDYPEAHFNLATAYLLMPQAKAQAIDHFTQVLALEPDYPHRELIEKTLLNLKIYNE
jgi:tetratricopeptide (TPR) repeat protein